MRTQPQTIIQQLETHNGRLDKERIIAEAMQEGLDEFFQGVRMCLDNLYTFGIKQVPISERDGQGLSWSNFVQLAESLYRRELTGNAARDAVQLAMDVATAEQWNFWYRRILIKDLRCGVSEKTINTVAKKQKRPDYQVPVFECQLAQDGADHPNKMVGRKIVEPKLDGVRCLTVIDHENRTVTQYTRNGHVLQNFAHITEYLQGFIDEFGRSYVIDGEVMSGSFQDLMKQVHRKDNVEAGDAVLNVFDILPLSEFRTGRSVMGQRRRRQFLRNFENIFADSGFIQIVPTREFDLDSLVEQIEFQDYMKQMVSEGYEGVMVKDVDGVYECRRSASWLKMKPWIDVSLTVVETVEGTGRNAGRMGALLCRGRDGDRDIEVSVGSGFSDQQREEFWSCRVDGHVIEVRADAVTQNQDGTYSLRFPRFLRFRGFTAGEKI